MGTIDIDSVLEWRGRTVIDRNGEKIGTLRDIYLDESDRPAWASVHTALFGLRETVVPLAEARPAGDQVQLPYDGDHVKQAPNVDPDVQMSADEEELLYRHYAAADGSDEEEPSAESERPGAEAASAGGAAPDDAAASTRDDAETDDAASTRDDAEADDAASTRDDAETDDAMTRSEEEIVVGTRERVRGRARLKKYVVTDYVEKKIPVKREEVRLEFEPAEDEPPVADA
jgi:sporulation protein YlmC with PRC-barrel domain